MSMERLTEKITNIETGNVLAYRTKRDVSTIKAWRKLGEYEDAEEQGLLIRLPCKIGDVLYYTTKCGIKELIVVEMRIRKYYTDVFTEDIEGKKYAFISGEIGKTVFLTREEAEAALAEMEKL